MVHEHGGVEAVRQLLKSDNYQDGFLRLFEMNMLNSSCEAAILQLKYRSLFTEAERAVAKKRLKDMKWEAPKGW
jgi:hypothetical protein